MIIDRLSEDVLVDSYFLELYRKASSYFSKFIFKDGKNYLLSEKELRDILRFCDILSNSSKPENRNKAFQIVSMLNPVYRGNAVYQIYAKSVFSKLGNFPAIRYLTNVDNNLAELPFDRQIEQSVKEIIQAVPESNDFIFTDSQFDLYCQISDSKFFSFSGPTSMGKSFIIKSFIRRVLKNKPPENIVILVPTRALINQFAIDLNQELKDALEISRYRVLTNSSVPDIELSQPQNYIFVLTPERLISFLSQPGNPSIGYLFVDEAHKIASEKDIRSITAYTAIERTLKQFTNINLYFASPNVSNPGVFLELFKKDASKSFRTIEASVSQNLFYVDLISKSGFHYVDGEPIEFKSEIINSSEKSIDFIHAIGSKENNLIYCNSRKMTIERANELYLKLKNVEVEVPFEVKKVISQIKGYIHKDYYLVDLLSKGIAFHFGNLPQIIRNKIEYLFKENHLNYIFCTSTLLEGVNLPAKNVFILKEKSGDGKSTMSNIDFWNLAGRAGRLKFELSGNIFCVRDNVKDWKKTDLLVKQEILLTPTVSNGIDLHINKIEALLADPNNNITPIYLKSILSYIANIINIDTLEFKTSQRKSVIIEKLIQDNKETILELASIKTNNFIIPLSILNLNQSVDIGIQDSIFKEIIKNKNSLGEFKLPYKVDYESCLSWLNNFYKIYKWDRNESDLFNAKEEFKQLNQLKYYALLMNKWINGSPLSQIITESILYYTERNKEIKIDWGVFELFNKNNKAHVNILIGNIIDDIEKKLRFLFEKYFNNYYTILTEITKEENAGANWATYLEYGATNPIIISLQNIGISRHSANYLYDNYSNCLRIENGKLVKIDINQLRKQLSKDDFEFDEISSILF